MAYMSYCRYELRLYSASDCSRRFSHTYAPLRFFFEKLFPDMLLKTGAQFSVPTGDYIQSLGPEQKITDYGI